MPNLELLPLEFIPESDRALWRQYPVKCRSDVGRWIARLMPIRDAEPYRKSRQAMRQVADETGYTLGQIKTKFYAWKNVPGGGRFDGWLALVNKSKYPLQRSSENCPDDFVQFWFALLEKHQRADSGKAAWGALISRWKRWRSGEVDCAIPGFDSPPVADEQTGVPRGWGYDNLMAKKRSNLPAFSLAARRQGAKRAAEELPSNYQTRMGLAYLENILWDDHIFDRKVLLPWGSDSNSKPMRPAGFFAIDRLTGKFIHKGIRLDEWVMGDTEKGRTSTLKGEHFVWAFVDQLRCVGYRRGSIKTTAIVEHGTATGPAGWDERLRQVTGIRTSRSSLFDYAAFSSMGLSWKPPGKGAKFDVGASIEGGNPRFKGLIEQSFRLVETRMAALPGPTGSNERANGPEESTTLDRYCRYIMEAFADAPSAVQEFVRFPYLTNGQFSVLADWVFDVINGRTDHALEGWEDCQFVVPALQLPEAMGGLLLTQQQLLANYGPEEQAAIVALAKPKMERLSPRDAAELAQAEQQRHIVRLQPEEIPDLIPMEWAQRVKVGRKHEITIARRSISARKFRYFARWKDPRTGAQGTFAKGTEFMALLNPFNPTELHLMDMDGRYMASVPEFAPARGGDVEAILINQRRIDAVKRDLSVPTERRLEMTGLPAARASMMAENDRLLAKVGKGRDAPTKAAKRGRKRGQNAEAALDALAGSAPAVAGSTIEDFPADDGDHGGIGLDAFID